MAKGGHGERAEREPITGSGAAPSGVQGQSPWSGGQGERPSNIVEFCNSCWKMAKSAPFHIKSPTKNFHGRAKGEGASHRAPPFKYATALNNVTLIFCHRFCHEKILKILFLFFVVYY